SLFAPRFGAVYRLTEKTVVRAGFGISYEPFPDNNYAFNFPLRQNNAFNAANSFSYAQLSSTDATLVNMKSGLPAPSPVAIPSNGIIAALAAGQPDPNRVAAILLGQDFNVVNRNFKQPYVEAFNLAVQRALPGN